MRKAEDRARDIYPGEEKENAVAPWTDICKTGQLPDDGKTVLTCCIDADGNMYQLLLAKYDSGLCEWIGQDGQFLCVEYWMPIPKYVDQ